MNMKPIRQIAVVGAGLMGHGIALDFALAGFEVNLQDLDAQKVSQATGRIQAVLQMLAAAGTVPPQDVGAVSARIHGLTVLKEAVSDADLVVESVFEDLALKRTLFGELDGLCPPHTILASNTSSFPPTFLAAVTGRPEKVIVAHYFNPPYLLPLVEVVKGEATSEETASTVCTLLKQAGKKPVLLKKEAPGFIANRLQAALVREALAIVDRGIADPRDVDRVIQHGFGRRLAVAGVFEVLDLAGLDLMLAVASSLLPELESSGQVPPWFRDKVGRGEIGVRSGQGFYPWTPESAAARSRAIAQALLRIAGMPGQTAAGREE
jgi:3-hydroxybutyryl-CoA dehydrogenase